MNHRCQRFPYEHERIGICSAWATIITTTAITTGVTNELEPEPSERFAYVYGLFTTPWYIFLVLLKKSIISRLSMILDVFTNTAFRLKSRAKTQTILSHRFFFSHHYKYSESGLSPGVRIRKRGWENRILSLWFSFFKDQFILSIPAFQEIFPGKEKILLQMGEQPLYNTWKKKTEYTHFHKQFTRTLFWSVVFADWFLVSFFVVFREQVD